ncbi:MAG: amino acid adenylation domain-containing protein [Chloroflexi bacterium]|nr:amino acid adenylation domain-containing protein [Chloroflexota bacterium]
MVDEAALQDDELLTVLLDEEGFSAGRTRAIRPREMTTDPPLSFAQQRLWFLDQLVPGEPFYNLASALCLSGKLEVAALERSFSEITRRHETLRTTFHPIESRPVQVIAPATPLTLPVVDLSRLPETERDVAAVRLAQEEARRPFDLARGPLLRATLLRLGAEEHVLLLTLHHIASDDWSKGVLNRELAALYEAYAVGRPSPLPEPAIQYADFAVWQRERLRGEALEAQLAYWKRQLAGLPELDLPAARPRPPVQSFRGDRHSLLLPEALSEALKALSRREGATLFMTLLAAFQTLLARYTGQDDVVVGSPIAGRNRVEIEPLIGFFVNTLVLRTDLSGDPTFRELLARVRNVALGAYGHQELPFEQLVEALQPERDLSRNPLFQVTFVLQNTPSRPLQLRSLAVRPMVVDGAMEKFDLTLSMRETEQGLEGSLRYSTDLFDGPTIARMAGHLRILLEGIVADPDRRLSELPLLTEPEHYQMLVQWNATATEYPSDRCIHELFEAQAARTPDAVAVVFEDRQLTYRELDAHANRLAHHLRGRGVGPEVPVGICVERSLEMVIGLLGILKAGGGYLPLDPTYPTERLAFMLDDARAPVVVTHGRLLEALSDRPARVVCLDTDRDRIARESDGNPISGATAANLAYIIYTSGSTGRPKGVEIRHDSVLNLVAWHQRVYGVTPADRATQLAGPAFDASVWEVWPYLTAGASIHLPDEMTRTSPPKLLEWLAARGITLCFLPTPLAEAVLEGPWPTGLALRALLTGGDQLRRRPREGLPFSVVNHYGPTECTVVTTWGPVSADSETGAPPPIGRPIANTRVYVLDRQLQPVPVGVPGELHIGGDGLAQGYLHRPELTAERFVSDPFGGEPGARLYKTGDLARYCPDGSLEFLGRLDDQVKIRGFRVEPGEVEVVLGQHPAVREAVVLAREDQRGDQRLVAYVVAVQDSTPTPTDLRGFLRAKLPEYMVPAAFVPLAALPLTPNGKVDRRALPAPDRSGPELDSGFVPARTPVEATLARMWAEILGLDRVGIHDDFFALGGHSLLATQLVSRVRDAFRVDLPLRRLFETPTIAGLAEGIEREGRGGQLREVAITPVSRERHRAKLSSLSPGADGPQSGE